MMPDTCLRMGVAGFGPLAFPALRASVKEVCGRNLRLRMQKMFAEFLRSLRWDGSRGAIRGASLILLTGAMVVSLAGSLPRGAGAPMVIPAEPGMTPTTYSLPSHTAIFAVFAQAYAAADGARRASQDDIRDRAYSRSELKAMAKNIAVEENIEPAVFNALVIAESDYDVNATSPKGAMSLTQLMPATAAELGLTPDEYYHPVSNLRGGARYFRMMLDATGDVGEALAAYNAGLARTRKRSPNDWPAETRNYVAKVLRISGAPSRVSFADIAPSPSAAFIGAIVSMDAVPDSIDHREAPSARPGPSLKEQFHLQENGERV